jgi:acetamidase/formamidase
LALASSVVDLRVTQVANGVWGVHAVLADDALRVTTEGQSGTPYAT